MKGHDAFPTFLIGVAIAGYLLMAAIFAGIIIDSFHPANL